MEHTFILSALRTAVGSFGGALKDFPPAELGALVARQAIAAAGITGEDVGHAVFGQVMPTEPADAYLARVIAIRAGVHQGAPGLTVNRLCGSGLQAVVSATRCIKLGECGFALAGGAEVMSRVPFFAPQVRFGRKMGDSVLIDGLTGALTDPFGNGLMGATAENVASRYGISRAQQDALALESHRRAAAATEAGYFRGQIVPVEISSRKGKQLFQTDEHVKPATTLADLEKLKTIFRPDGGTVTAGNSSGINDGAAALILASGTAVRERGLKPRARIMAYGYAGVDPSEMGMGPVPASRQALERAGLKVSDMDVIESNEAFAAQACAVSRELGFDPKKLNPNGSGISIGHPVGATGAILLTKLVHELERIGGRYGLATMCIGGGQGIAAVIENVR
jgi:acetyl-CoA C-acetyltransferase